MVYQARTYSVLIVSASEQFNGAIAPLLPPTDYYPVRFVPSVAEAQRKLQDSETDLVIINAPLPDGAGTKLAIHACSGGSAAVLLLVKSEVYEEITEQMLPEGILTLSKPTNMQSVAQNLRGLRVIRERLRRMEERQDSIEKKIEEIRMVNRAKWVLIECLGMTEEESHRYIEKQAMDLRISKREIAENIIKTYKG